MAAGPFTSLWMRLRVYTRPGQAIKNQFGALTQRFTFIGQRFRQFGNSILPEGMRKRLGLGAPKKRGKDGAIIDDDAEFGELSERKGRRLSGGRKLKPLQKQAQFSQIHLINQINHARKISHIGQKVDRSWTEMFVEVDEENSVRLTYTIVDRAVYGSNVAITYERGDAEILVDNKTLTHDISLPVFDESTIRIAGVPYMVDMFKYESLPVKTRVDAAWVTNVGPVRDDNQDAIGIYQHDDAYMFTIADGVGGGYAGDIVSEYAVKYLLKTFQKNIKHNLSWIKILRKAFQHTNAEVRKFVERSPYPAGTTLTTVVIREWTAFIAHVGDSRVYHLRGTRMEQLTVDHRETHPVERTTKYEHIPDEFLPMRDVLVRAIGKRDAIDPQIITMAVQPGDKLLMITDGVTHQVSDEEIYNILITETIDDAPDTLVKLSNERENTDNASVILVNIMEKAFEKDIWRGVASDRVYIGGKNWKLDLSRPHEMRTQYEVPNQVGCLSAIITLLACAFLWWGIPRLTGTVVDEPQNAAQIVESVNETQTEIVATSTIVPSSTPRAVTTVQPNSTTETSGGGIGDAISGLLSGLQGGSATLPTALPTGVELVATGVPTQPTNVITIQPDATETPLPIVPTATSTLIPPSPTSSFTPTPYISPTPFPTLPSTVGPTATQIPPTSTLRA